MKKYWKTQKYKLYNQKRADKSLEGGYFLDMQEILTELKRIIRPNGKLCIVVGTSSYYKVTIPTDLLIAGLSVDIGFRFEEIRVIRKFKRSTQQARLNGKSEPPLRESILIFSVAS